MSVFSVLLQNALPMLSSQQLVQRLYPYNSILGKDGRTAVEGVLSVSQDVNHQNAPNCHLYACLDLNIIKTHYLKVLILACLHLVAHCHRGLSLWMVVVSRHPAPF